MRMMKERFIRLTPDGVDVVVDVFCSMNNWKKKKNALYEIILSDKLDLFWTTNLFL